MYEELTQKLINVFNTALTELTKAFEKELGVSTNIALIGIISIIIEFADNAELLEDAVRYYYKVNSNPKVILKEDIVEFKTKYMLSLKEELDSVKNDNEILRAAVAELCKKKESEKEN